jgi:hypothetical protein
VTQACKIINGHLHSPYFIFVRAAGRFSDDDILKLLGLGDFATHPLVVDWSKPQIFITEDDLWIHIADDCCYNLGNKGHYQLVEDLHKKIPDVPIFACSVGDVDWSFDFAYYVSGQLQRRYTVEDPRYDKHRRVVTEDFGQPLPLEMALSEIGEEQDYVLSLATGLGVKINHDLRFIRCYATPSPKIVKSDSLARRARKSAANFLRRLHVLPTRK